MVPEGNRRGRPRDGRIDAAILDAALSLFLAGGLAATTFEGVAERAGVSRSTVYRRWRTRDELLVAALEHLRDRGEEGAENWESLPISEVVAIFEELTVVAAVDARSVGLLRAVFALDNDSPIKHHHWSEMIGPRRKAFAEMIVRARREGELPDGLEPYLLQDLLGGAIAYRLLMNPKPLDERAARHYVHELLGELGLLSDRPARGPL